jgi:hypothetical protein
MASNSKSKKTGDPIIIKADKDFVDVDPRVIKKAKEAEELLYRYGVPEHLKERMKKKET